MEISFDEIKRTPFEEIGSQFHFLENISSGSFGSVVRAIDINTEEIVAIKIINKLSNKINPFKIKEEINILKSLNHPNILKFYDYIETNAKVYIIMEELKGGTLGKWINQHKNENITEEESSLIIKNILSAVSYLHSKNICHRDIKPENIMFKENSNINSLKLIDFNLSIKNFNDYGEQTYCGTYIYMAPEQLENTFYSKIIDIWSIGIILYELLNKGQHPFYIKGVSKRNDLIQNIKKHNLKCHCNVSKMGDDLLKKMLEPQPTIRISAKNALKHPWITRSILAPIPLNLYQKMFKEKILKKTKDSISIILFLNFFAKRDLNVNYIIKQDYMDKIKKENKIQNDKFYNMRLKDFKFDNVEKCNNLSFTKDNKIDEDNSPSKIPQIKQSTNVSTDKTSIENNTNINVLNSKNSNNSNSFKKKLYQKINFEEKHTKSPIKNPKVPIKMTKMFINNQIYHFKNRNLINKTVLKKNNKKNEPLPSIISNTSLKNQSIDHYHEKINLKYTINSNYKTINVTPFKLFDNNKTLKKNFQSSSLDNINVSKLGFNTRNVVKKKTKRHFSLSNIIVQKQQNIDLIPIKLQNMIIQQRKNKKNTNFFFIKKKNIITGNTFIQNKS